MADYSIMDVANEIRRMVRERDIGDESALAFRRKFPGLTHAQYKRAMGVATDEEMMTNYLAFEAECEEFEAFLDTLPKKPEAVHELEESDHRTPLRRFLAKRGQQE